MLYSQVEKNDDYMKPVILINKNETELLTNSSLMLIKGEVGSGKSRLAMNLMKGLLVGKEDLNFSYSICPPDKFVVYISTEMSKYHLQRRLLKVIEDVPEDVQDRLVFLDVCTLSVEDKQKALLEAVRDFPPHVIVIDQLADFVSNINDIEQSNSIINKLMNGIEKTDCAVIGIIHQNEDSGISAKARGHLGSTLEQKVVSSVAIADSSKGFKIKTTKLREGTNLNITAKFNTSTEMLIETTRHTSNTLSTLSFPISRNSLIAEIVRMENCSERTAEEKIRTLVENKTLSVTKDGRNNIYNLVENEGV